MLEKKEFAGRLVVDFEVLKRSEALRGYRMKSLRPFLRTCLACNKEVAEGDWCCIGFYQHFAESHGEGWVAPERFEHLRAIHARGTGSCQTCQENNAKAREAGL